MVVQTRTPAPAPVVTHKDLPDKDGAIVTNPYQLPQAAMLTSSVLPVLERIHQGEPYLVMSDAGIYWRQTAAPLDGCKAPDWCYIPGVAGRDADGPLRSYVLWNHGIRPVVVMEFVSGDGAEEHDRTPGTGKFWVYEQGIGAAYYVIFDTFGGGALEVFELIRNRYRPVPANERGHFPIADLGLEVGVWEGRYGYLDGFWVRFFDADGRLLSTAEEGLEAERQRAAAAADELNVLRGKLRAKGIDPDSL